jgi:hypothetical protein
MAKPTSKVDWTVGNPSFGSVTVEPSAGKKQTGWTASERPPFQFMNWLFYNILEWINYFETTTDGLIALQGTYDAVVGVGGTHASLAALMADPNIATIKNVLVTDPVTLTAPVVLNQNDMSFTFTPKAIIAKGVGANIGLSITAERVRILNGRFMNFSTAGDKAIQLSGASKYCMISQNYFVNCDTTVDDLGTTNGLFNNIEEV